jgi:hypothetical protein
MLRPWPRDWSLTLVTGVNTSDSGGDDDATSSDDGGDGGGNIGGGNSGDVPKQVPARMCRTADLALRHSRSKTAA